ncbi:site-specific DNA-methyltransferase [Kineosporia babensis]|uniref:Site-specific DNA-methyltransferase n=1 Tax=Kineosporia babensis TaxID=499548 RepID=A0A9X1SRE5_9ACTN|nr:site-specific DNA-methyltransferase [Kineosporia babensis]MCD5309534.1 site-specific DNA-methyltransferase [Kineosporia babensis]
MTSPDAADGNVDKLAELFPSAVTEQVGADEVVRRVIDFDMLRQELAGAAVEGPQERYHLEWPGKRKAALAANTPVAKTLRPVRADSVDFDTTRNLFIEGDNLDALKLLQESYLGQVKLIYIDPPYNTGNDFVYNDDFSVGTAEYLLSSGQMDASGARLVPNPESGGRFHSDWLSMIYARLKLARSFLSDDGIIAVSIDDKEQARVAQILDELFGDDGRVAQVVVQANKGGRDYLALAQTHEYLLIYGRSGGAGIYDLPRDVSDLPLADEVGRYVARDLRNRNPRFSRANRPNLFYPFYVNPALTDANGYAAVSLEPSDEYPLAAVPLNREGVESCWRWGREKVSAAIVAGDPKASTVVARQVRGGAWNVYEKHRPSTQKVKTVWDEKEVRTEAGTREIRELFGATVFDHPKPVDLLKKLIAIATTPDALVLDFFAGSGASAHAVMALNREDGGRRRFIAVQLPEACAPGTEAFKAGFETIAEVAKERLRRAGRALAADRPLLDKGFRVLRVDSTNLVDAVRAPGPGPRRDLVADLVKPDRTPEDLLFQVLLSSALPLDEPIAQEKLNGKQVFVVGELTACFDAGIDLDLIRALAERRPPRLVLRESGFASDQDLINAGQVFREIVPDTDVKLI